MKRNRKCRAAVALMGCLVFALCFLLWNGNIYAKEEAPPAAEWENYGQTIYNTTNGLMSNNVSSIAQTSDGEVWIGTDAGLSAFDGNEFTEYGTFFHFDGVNDMIRTRSGGVWFATSTYGGAIYLGSRFQHFDDVSERASNYATSIAEDSNGVIYVGTVRNMVIINPAAGYTLSELAGQKYFYVNSLAAGRDNIVGAATVNGDIFFLKDGVELCRFSGLFTGNTKLYYAEGYYFAGTSDGEILVFDEENLETGVVCRVPSPVVSLAGSGRGINNFFAEEGERLWVLAEGGIGYYVLDGRQPGDMRLDASEFIQCSFDGFESGFTDMMTDYQGNYWISSSKRGVLLLRQSGFTDELSQLGLDNDSVNAVNVQGGVIYAATDSGLVAVRQQDKAVLNDGKEGPLAGKRLTDVVFYRGEQITAVYGEGVYAGEELLPVEAKRINRLQIIEDKLYVLADEGCFVWEGTKTADSFTAAENLYNTRLTCALYGAFGRQSESRLYLGSEGAGIYVMFDGALEECLDENSGLPSKMINDMLAYEKGFFIATDGGIAYYNGRKMAELKFPKELDGRVCEELFIQGGELYVVCRDSVYIINLETLFHAENGAEPKYAFYDRNAGFFGQVTDGAHGCMDGTGRIYLPCTEKIYSLSGIGEEADISSFRLLLQSVEGDGRSAEIVPVQDKEYAVSLTKDVEEIDIFCSVLNFSNADPYVRYILHGVDKDYTKVRNSELEHIIYEGLPGGSYTFWFELVDSEGEMADRIVLTITKEESFFEKLWVRMAGLGSGFGILMYFVFKDRKKKVLCMKR